MFIYMCCLSQTLESPRNYLSCGAVRLCNMVHYSWYNDLILSVVLSFHQHMPRATVCWLIRFSRKSRWYTDFESFNDMTCIDTLMYGCRSHGWTMYCRVEASSMWPFVVIYHCIMRGRECVGIAVFWAVFAFIIISKNSSYNFDSQHTLADSRATLTSSFEQSLNWRSDACFVKVVTMSHSLCLVRISKWIMHDNV